jgi:hypothetical protein
MVQDFEEVNRRELTKLKAYLNYKARGKLHSSKDEQTADWKAALAEVNDMAARGATEADFLKEFIRASANLITEGDWSQFSRGGGQSDTDIRRSMLGNVLTQFCNMVSSSNDGESSSVQYAI